MTVPYSTLNWDSGKVETCLCDPGFFGPDCSQRAYGGRVSGHGSG